MAVENPVNWIQCSDEGCNGRACGVCAGQIFLVPDPHPHWHVGDAGGTAYHDRCYKQLRARP